MRERIRDLGRLQHILEHIDRASQFLNGKTLADLENDALLRYAVVKCLEIIGEAAYMLSPEFKDDHLDTPWLQIEKMRHVLVHGYYQILPEVLWLTIKDDLPALKANVLNYLSSLEE